MLCCGLKSGLHQIRAIDALVVVLLLAAVVTTLAARHAPPVVLRPTARPCRHILSISLCARHFIISRCVGVCVCVGVGVFFLFLVKFSFFCLFESENEIKRETWVCVSDGVCDGVGVSEGGGAGSFASNERRRRSEGAWINFWKFFIKKKKFALRAALSLSLSHMKVTEWQPLWTEGEGGVFAGGCWWEGQIL